MRLKRYLKEDLIDLAFDPLAAEDEHEDEDEDEGEGDGEEELSGRRLFALKERVLAGLVELIDRSGRVSNPRKLLTDLRNREAKATTGLGGGVAMPHVRTSQARGFAMAVAIAPEPGIPFDAVDQEPVRIFFPMVAPAHDDKFYLKVERALAEAFADGDDLREQLLAAESPGEVIHLLSQVID